MDKVSENISGGADKIAGAVQPRMTRPDSVMSVNILISCSTESEKSTTQKLSDSTRSGADSTQKDAKTLAQSVSDTASSLTQSASDTLKSTGEFPNHMLLRLVSDM